MGLMGDIAWSLDQLVALILLISNTFTPPYTIVIFSLYGMGEVQRALATRTEGSPSPGGARDKLQLTPFMMVKVNYKYASLFAASSNAKSPVHTQPYNVVPLVVCNHCRIHCKRAGWVLGQTFLPI